MGFKLFNHLEKTMGSWLKQKIQMSETVMVPTTSQGCQQCKQMFPNILGHGRRGQGRNCKPPYCRDKASPFCLHFRCVLCQLITIPIQRCEEGISLIIPEPHNHSGWKSPLRFPAPSAPPPLNPQCRISTALNTSRDVTPHPHQ